MISEEYRDFLQKSIINHRKIKRLSDSNLMRDYISPKFIEYLNTLRIGKLESTNAHTFPSHSKSTKLKSVSLAENFHTRKANSDKEYLDLKELVKELKYMVMTMSESLHSILKVQKVILSKLNEYAPEKAQKEEFFTNLTKPTCELGCRVDNCKVNFGPQGLMSLVSSESTSKSDETTNNQTYGLYSLKHRDRLFHDGQFLEQAFNCKFIKPK